MCESLMSTVPSPFRSSIQPSPSASTKTAAAFADALLVVLRRAETGHDVELVGISLPLELRAEQLQLVQDPGLQYQYLGPDVRLVVRQEVPHGEALGESRALVVLGHPDES